MPTSKTKASTNGSKAKAKAKAKATTGARKAPASRNQTRSVAETVVDFPVGVVLSATDRIAELAEPFTGRSAAEKQLKAYRTQLRRSLKRSERRGTTARRKALTEARKTRTRLERVTNQQRRSVETAVKRNRDEVEDRVRKAIEAQTSRAQGLVEQLSALR
jgi:hypothetical protein